MTNKAKFHFPKKIDLATSPLHEAWLTIQWKLDSVEDNPQILRDKFFPLALGRFDHVVKEKYKYRAELPIAQAPEEVTPHIVRYQFRQNGPDGSPLLQIGPGIASVNFIKICPWEPFKEEALFLRQALSESYSEKKLLIDSLSLTYRNGVPFKYSEENLGEFLSKRLNTTITFPQTIPGEVTQNRNIKNLNISTAFALKEPTGSTGKVRIITGSKKEKLENQEIVIFDTEVTGSENLPDFNDQAAFSLWLDQAHAICHEWFMAFIEGSLYKHYSQKEEQNA